jgi:hypothetical protein
LVKQEAMKMKDDFSNGLLPHNLIAPCYDSYLPQSVQREIYPVTGLLSSEPSCVTCKRPYSGLYDAAGIDFLQLEILYEV